MTYFVVHHIFRPETKDGFFEFIGNMKPEDWGALTEKNNKLGFHNHTFFPSEEGQCFCVWETKDESTSAEFQKFIDGPDGPSPGTFHNVVHKLAPGATPPYPSHFSTPN